MIVNITYPKFKAFAVLNGTIQYAARYKVWAFEAGAVPGLGTAIDTYSDPDCLVANAWPVVLDADGEASIYTNRSIKLLLSTPTGDWSSPIWSVDDLAEQQNTVIISGESTPPTADNNYVCDVVPPFTAFMDNLTLVMEPDADSLDTLGSTVHTGSGINDLTFSGPYIGSNAGPVFSVEMRGVGTPVAVTIAENVAVGLVTVGNHYVKIAAVTATGVSLLSAASNVVNAAGARKIDVTGIPAISGLITAYNIYMTKAGGTAYYYVAQVTATTYTINVADAGLTVAAPEYQTATDWVRWRKDGGAWTDQVLITALVQTTIEGVAFRFAQKINHTVGDVWTVQVMTPARLNFCSLGNKLIYKIQDGQAVALDGGDIKDGIPATLVYSAGLPGWILNNPSLPVLSTLKPYRERVDITAAYTITTDDIGKELSCFGTFALNFPALATIPHHWGWIRNSGPGLITLTANGAEKILCDLSTAGYSTVLLAPGEMVMWTTNGVNVHLAGMPTVTIKETLLTSGTSITTDPRTRRIKLRLVGGGGGGGGVNNGATGSGGGGGGAGGYAEKIFDVTPATAYTYAIGVGGAGGTAVPEDGGNGGDTTFIVGAVTVTAFGGAGGGLSTAPLAIRGGAGGVISTNGDVNVGGQPGAPGLGEAALAIGGNGGSGPFGAGGLGAIANAAATQAGADAVGYGAGGGGGAVVNNSAVGGAGMPGCILVLEYT